jgi:hypothetical protein
VCDFYCLSKGTSINMLQDTIVPNYPEAVVKAATFMAYWKPRRTAEKALGAVIQEAYIQGVSTRSVDELIKAMSMRGISKSQVSRLCTEIDDRAHAFLGHPIEGDWPDLWIDATYLKVREAERTVSVAVIITVAVNTGGDPRSARHEHRSVRSGAVSRELSALAHPPWATTS